MEYIVSARKYRPMSFDSVVGQAALTTTLKNAVKSGKLAHAYLFCGPRGVGKTTCARIFAKAINCQQPTAEGEACNECESCRAFNEQRSFNIFELDAASNNSVENIKALMEQTRIPPQIGKYKVFIIDEVHMLSTAAFNSFLKTLEEPPSHVIFILATTEKHKILPTIISRCQIYDFERMSVPNIIDHLKMVAKQEGFTYEEEALNVIAEKADGGMRDALSIFDQAASFCQGNITYAKVIEDLNVLDTDNYFQIVDLSLENKVSDVMVLLNNVISKGFDGGHLVGGLASHIRNVLMAKDEATLPLLEVSARQKERYREQAGKCPTPFLYNALRVLNQCDINYRQSSNKRLLVELTLIEVAQITQEDETPGSGRRPASRIKTLFKKLAASLQPQTAPQVAAAETSAQRPVQTAPGEETAIVSEPKVTSYRTGSAPAKPANLPKFKMGSIFNTLGAKKQKEDTDADSNKALIDKSETPNSGNRQEDFTQTDLERKWMSMCNRMPDEMTGLAARMKNISPHITDYPNIELVVDNQNLIDQITPIKNRIRITIANELNNKDIQFSIRLAKDEEVKKILTKKELFELMRQQNPVIEKMREQFGLELA